MKLTKRDGVYYADLRDVGGGRVSLKTTDKGVAALRLREEYSKVTKATEQGQKVTLRELFQRCMKETDWHSAKDQTGLASRYKNVAQYFGADCDVRTITYDALSRFVGKRRAAGVKDSTIHRDLSLLSPMLRQAHLWGYIPAPVQIPWTKGEAGTRMWIYTRDQERDVRDWLYTNGNEAVAELVGFLADTGFRISEALGRFEIRNGTAILWDQKNGKQTATPLTPRAVVSGTLRLWTCLSYEQVSDVWDKARAAMGWPLDANLHAWRHTCATRLAQKKLTAKQIQAFMRHSSLNTTMKYIKLLAGDIEECAVALSSFGTQPHDTVPSVPPLCHDESLDS